jgi:hypothetical protein
MRHITKKTYNTPDGDMTEQQLRDAICDGWGAYDTFCRQDVIEGLGGTKGVDNALTMLIQKGTLHIIDRGVYAWAI